MSAATSVPDADQRPVTARSEQAADLAIAAGAAALHLPTIRTEATRIAAAAVKERLTHKAFLAEVLTAELDDRDARRRTRRIHEAKFPRLKRLEDLDLRQLPGLPAPLLAALSAGAWIDRGEPVVLLGDSGTGKTHLLIGLGPVSWILLSGPEDQRGEQKTTAVVAGGLVVAGGDAAPLLEPVEATLDDVAALVGLGVEAWRPSTGAAAGCSSSQLVAAFR